MTASPHIVVIGSGLAGYGVVRELRKLAPDARLTLVTRDDGHFYSKPALSTALAKGKVADTLVTTPAEKMAAQLRLDLRAGREVEAIDREDKAVLTTGGPIFYDKLVLALGADPVRPPIDGDAAHRALAVNNLDNYREFRAILPEGARVLVMGGGLVGTEFANDLSATGYCPVVVDMLSHPLAQLVPAGVGSAIREALAAKGVEWHLGRKVLAIHKSGTGIRAELDGGETIEAAAVLSAVGLRPHLQLAADAGLDVARGIVVDQTGRTSDPHIFAIGDCAQYPQGLAAYVTPIMAAARAIAPSVLGTPMEIRFPPLSVQVKTTACPVVLLPAPQGVEGAWEETANDEKGLKYLFRDRRGSVRGYVFTQDYCQERMNMDRALSEQTTGLAA
ncbi:MULTISPECIES: NAD(P)/FAD-dependent oxidoreductase [Novosphingobium]|uniref:Pyridine nucleotide-disulfide oxidoreductase n=1 Tax=Novosphingobium resinovorum TaxID=158500 RepID=A0A1D8AFW3_9SPHN|nr:FAD-dependent oxidoreductase [Novosphingobium resinovorum]AOR80951.1 pyridine nucleotide-disulfide oxidoreductase [Novosphingobium resinovorum]GLK45451.1 pyridine nucleotide-disulfide oxidoreductase [Novosphingobium resinovorum]